MNGYLPGGSNRLTESVKTMNLRPLNLLLTGTLLFLVGCIQTDTAEVYDALEDVHFRMSQEGIETVI